MSPKREQLGLHLLGHVAGEENLNVAAGELRHDAAVVAVLPVVAGLQDGQGGQS